MSSKRSPKARLPLAFAALLATLLVAPIFDAQIAMGVKKNSVPQSIQPLTGSVVGSSTIVDGGYTIGISGKVTISNGIPIKSATLIFQNTSSEFNPWADAYSDSQGNFQIDLTPGIWRWRVISYNNYYSESSPAMFPYETNIKSTPSLPPHLLYGSFLTVGPGDSQTLDIEIPVREVGLKVINNSGDALPSAKIIYSPSLSWCNEPNERQSYCFQSIIADNSGRAKLSIYDDICDLCLDDWHTSERYAETETVPSLSYIGLSQLSQPNIDTFAGTIYAVDPESPALFAKISGSQLVATSTVIRLPAPVNIQGEVKYSSSASTVSGDVSTIAVIRYYNEILGISSATTAYTDDSGQYSFKAAADQSGVFEVLLRDPERESLGVNAPLEVQFSRPEHFVAGFGRIFQNEQMQLTNIESASPQVLNFEVPSYRKVTLEINKREPNLGYNQPDPPWNLEVPAVDARVTTGFERDFVHTFTPFLSTYSDFGTQLAINESGRATYFVVAPADDWSPYQLKENEFKVVDPETGMQVPHYCQKSDPFSNECYGFIYNWSNYFEYGSAVFPLIYSSTTDSITIEITFPRPAVFYGSVKDIDGKPIRNATFSIGNVSEDSLHQTRTDSQGNFEIFASPMSLINYETGQNLRLAVTGPIASSDFDKLTYDKQFFALGTTTSDLPPMFRQTFRGRPYTSAGFPTQLSDDKDTLQVVVPRMATIKLRVFDPITNSPVPNALIRISPQACRWDTDVEFSQSTSNFIFQTTNSKQISSNYSMCATSRLKGDLPSELIEGPFDSNQDATIYSDETGVATFKAIAEIDSYANQDYAFTVFDPNNLARQTSGTFTASSIEDVEEINVNLPSPPPPPDSASVIAIEPVDGISGVEVTFEPADSNLIETVTGDLGVDGYVVEAVPFNYSGSDLRVISTRNSPSLIAGDASPPNILETNKIATRIKPQIITSILDNSTNSVELTGLVYGIRYKVLVHGWNTAGIGKSRQIILTNGYVASAPNPPLETDPVTPTPTATPTPTSQKDLGGGLLSSSSRFILEGKVIVKPSSTISEAPKFKVLTENPFTPIVRSLPAKKVVSATITISGKKIQLGKFKVNSKGTLRLPTFVAAKPGTYLIQLTDKSGRKYFAKIVVVRKK